MNFILTFILGIFVAISSLITQVFVSLIAELFFHIKNLTFQYDMNDTIKNIIILIVLAAMIEECLRYIVIKYQISKYTRETTLLCIIYGILFGFGFATLEALMLFLGNSLSLNNIILFIPVIFIHTIASVFLMLTITKNSKIQFDIIFILLAILFHASANLILYNSLI
ncbi:MAG: PrsW family glutamic-type intramembrane protease [Candidatus Moraniibacteriota bacterium]|jgi:protease prsW family protein